MARNSKIEWTHHTFNPWWGCTKVSDACKHCYAEAWAKRVGSRVWGVKAARRFFGDTHWQQPERWDREAEQNSTRRRVFCASMADVFEDRAELNSWRNRLWSLIERTPNLDWLLLTKRPELVQRFVPWADEWPCNVWLGTTVENQEIAEKRLSSIAECRAAIRFASCEPLLGKLDLREWLGSTLHWVIAGGESGPKARPSDPRWFRELRDQCKDKEVPFHFKQWGNWSPVNGTHYSEKAKLFDFDGGIRVIRSSKKTSGRLLDGAPWDEVPDP